MSGYPFQRIEQKWQEQWEETQLFRLPVDKKPYYVLEMFPYPSGALHVGHVRNYVLGDILARFKAAQGWGVLHPIGWDAFGLPAENAALLNQSHPRVWTKENIAHMRKQLKSLGLSYDWSREFATCDAPYFKHEQEMFIQFWKKGLIVRQEGVVNWDPVDQTILANEQVENGRGWRSGALIEKRKMWQWFVRQSAYAQELLDGVDDLEGWPESVRTMQRNWIGRSEGAEVVFAVEGFGDLAVFSTRPETLYGATFCAVAGEHAIAQKAAQSNPKIAEFIEKIRKNPFDEKEENTIQEGIKIGYTATHPLTGEPLPIYVVNYVLAEYGTGAIFGCPAHDTRDFAFAQKYGLACPLVMTWDAPRSDNEALIIPCGDEGVMVNSGPLDGLTPRAAFERVTALLEEKGTGCKKIRYRLRDWCVSRQRYWGTPVPMIHCADCGPVPVPSEHLPVELPDDVTFDQMGNPLGRHPSWRHVACPQCGQDAQRDTDTLDTFFESCWYYLRFISQPDDQAFDKKEVARFLPVDWYIGGVEHAVMHLLYARLFALMLTECGYMEPVLPFKRLLTQGMVCYHTFRTKDGLWVNPTDAIEQGDGTYALKDGTVVIKGSAEKMSKSKKNTVDPDEVLRAYGADALRFFVVSDAPPERHFEWTDSGLHGAWRFAKKLYHLSQEHADLLCGAAPNDEPTKEFLTAMHRTIYAVTSDIEAMRLHLAVAHIRAFYNLLMEQWEDCATNAWYGWRVLVVLLEPFMPHLCAEIREQCAIDFVWPSYDEQYLEDDFVTIAIQVNGKMRGTVDVAVDTPQDVVFEQAMAIRQRCVHGEVRKVIFVPNRIMNIIV